MNEALKFQGTQGRIYNTEDIASALKDYLDIVLFNKTQKVEPINQPDRNYDSNHTFWSDSLERRDLLYPGQIVRLTNFKLLEWIPSSPGLFYTPKAKRKRDNARESHQRWREENERGFVTSFFPQKSSRIVELRPDDKRGFIQGGYGSLRVAPKLVNNELQYFLCASSTGVSHEGLTVTLRKEFYSKVVEELKKGKIPKVDLVGRLMILPEEFSPIKMRYHEGIPKYYLEILELDVNGYTSTEKTVVSVAITYAKKEDFIRRNSFSYSFCSFSPNRNNRDLREAVYWLQDYAERHSEEKDPIIIGDFDEEFNHFGNVEFPISEIAKGNIPINKLHYFEELFHYQINELIMGDKNVFKNSQIGAVGSNATSSNNTFQQINYNVPEDLDFEQLNGQLGQLRENLTTQAKTPQEFQAIAEVAQAEIAAKEKDGNKVVGHLKSAGKWVFDTAKDIGVDIVTELIKKQMEL